MKVSFLCRCPWLRATQSWKHQYHVDVIRMLRQHATHTVEEMLATSRNTQPRHEHRVLVCHAYLLLAGVRPAMRTVFSGRIVGAMSVRIETILKYIQ